MSAETTAAVPGPAAPEPAALRRARRSWYVYDWANSAYVTTTATVLFGPYLTSVARRAACPDLPTGQVCTRMLSVLGVPVAPGSVALYAVTAATLLAALLLPLIGAIADRTAHRARLLGVLAWTGAAAATAMVLVSGTRWQLGVLLLMVATTCLASSLVVYDALLCDVSPPHLRDRTSSRGWALGYLGGFLLLAANLALVSAPGAVGLDTEGAVRASLAIAGLWWAVFTIIPVLGLRNLPTRAVSVLGERALAPAGAGRGLLAPFRQLVHTLRGIRRYPQTLRFLLAYLIFNDGIQTVIYASSIYGQEELGFSQSQLITTILIVQGVAFLGALAFGRIAARFGAQRTILGGLGLWVLVLLGALTLQRGAFSGWLLLAVGIGLVLGGTQALSRSLYSQLVPLGQEAEFFSLYQAAERGTSWVGTLAFGLVFQLTGSYRPALTTLLAFFVVGAVLLARVDVARGTAAAAKAPAPPGEAPST
ncbi:UMF1 family MFS transporter [Kineococcus xinjiangensis]|uniref:UMF1 family MFS transporter n=1 Tax=Kineococcus xinjiangensis TaxID=512762 RepID=A0A2S6IKF3_9ACTN|nr:MFS transporter [Kineococcus xinjiangensis]PPK94713.1 UMF1 family MFS transporter [Kineococcus xinjiangensis]